jgi:hypothetical protein
MLSAERWIESMHCRERRRIDLPCADRGGPAAGRQRASGWFKFFGSSPSAVTASATMIAKSSHQQLDPANRTPLLHLLDLN